MYKSNEETRKGIAQIQKDNLENYGSVDIDKALNWLQEEVDELKEGVKNNDIENIKEELSQVFIWTLSIANIFGFKMEELVEKEFNHHLQKYPKKE